MPGYYLLFKPFKLMLGRYIGQQRSPPQNKKSILNWEWTIEWFNWKSVYSSRQKRGDAKPSQASWTSSVIETFDHEMSLDRDQSPSHTRKNGHHRSSTNGGRSMRTIGCRFEWGILDILAWDRGPSFLICTFWGGSEEWVVGSCGLKS